MSPIIRLKNSRERYAQINESIFFLGIFLFILAAKLWLISSFSNSTPYWDQWDGEAGKLLLPYLENQLQLSEIFSAHNEHRIVFTRILSLLLLELNQQWDPQLAMIVQAGIHAATMVMLVVVTTSRLEKKFRFGMGIILGLISMLPYAWENTLWGFQSQFYFVLLWGLIGIWLCWKSPTLSRLWFVGAFTLALGNISMAGGMIAPLAAGLLLAARAWQSPDTWRKELAGLSILASICIAGFLAVNHVPGHDALKAQSLGEAIDAFSQLACWPVESPPFAIIIQAPIVALLFITLKKRYDTHHTEWLLIALGAWNTLQILAIAYGRAHAGLESRYTDNFAFGICINAACLLHIVSQSKGTSRIMVSMASSLWITLIAFGLYSQVLNTIPNQLLQKKTLSDIQQNNLKAYIETKDITHLENKPWLHIPYPDSDRLAQLLNNVTIQNILPENIRPTLKTKEINTSQTSFTVDGYYHEMLPPPSIYSLGSYGEQGDATIGELTLTYNSNSDTARFKLNLAGYPSAENISLILKRPDGKIINLAPRQNPKEEWHSVYFHTPRGEFSITAIDQSDTKWLALDTPVQTGRLRPLLDALLKQSLTILSIAFWLITYGLISSYKAPLHEQDL